MQRDGALVRHVPAIIVDVSRVGSVVNRACFRLHYRLVVEASMDLTMGWESGLR